MGYKTRANYKLGLCLRQCANRDIKCKTCLKFSEYEKVIQTARRSNPKNKE